MDCAMRSALTRGRALTMAGTVTALIGTRLPWTTFWLAGETIGSRGSGGLGKFAAGLAVIILVAALLQRHRPGRRYSPASALLAVLVAGIACAHGYLMLLAETIAFDEPQFRPGVGVLVTILGALLFFLGGFMVNRRKQPRAGSTI
jgi:hypothetical protein